MKTVSFLLLSFIYLFFGFKNSNENNFYFKKKEDKFIIGDFDGDKKTDTIFEIHLSNNDNNIITEIPLIKDYDKKVEYYYKNSIRTYLRSSNKKIKDIDLGISFGTFSLINIGDNNNDNKDEIALIVDYCDFSNINSCKIYTLCNNQWKIIFKFNILESVFENSDVENLYTNEIKNYLIKKNGKWYYSDVLKPLYNKEKKQKMKLLKIKNCN